MTQAADTAHASLLGRVSALAEAPKIHVDVSAPRRSGILTRVGYGALGIVLLLAAMQAAVVSGVVSHAAMPTAVEMLVGMVQMAVSNSFLTAVASTLSATVVAWFVAAVLGTLIGLAVGSSRLLEAALAPLTQILRPIPAAAVLPVVILLLGTGAPVKITLGAYAAFWPVYINAVDGARNVDRLSIDVARGFLWGRLRILTGVRLPAAAPFIVNGLRLAASIALVIVVSVELLGARGGIGQIIRAYSAAGRVQYVYAGVVLTALLGLVLNVALESVERRLLSWTPQWRDAEAQR